MTPPAPQDIPLDGLSAAELLDLASRVAEAHTAAVAREERARLSARDRLVAAAEELGRQLGPVNPSQRDLTCLRAACRMTPEELAAKTPEVLQLLLGSVRDVVAVAQQAVLIGADQAR